jgi:hypothetical protein
MIGARAIKDPRPNSPTRIYLEIDQLHFARKIQTAQFEDTT